MKSKDCLDLLMSNQKKVKGGFEFINLKTKERVTIEDCYEIIIKDLEVLEILKSMLTVEKGSTWYYLDTKHPFFEKQEDINKVKEWLEND